MRLPDFSRVIVFGLAIICAALPVIANLQIPMPVTQDTINFFNVMETLEAGDTVLILEGSPGHRIVCTYSIPLAYNHAYMRGCRVIGASTRADAAPLIWMSLEETLYYTDPDMEYGVDYIAYNFIPGRETGLKTWAKDTYDIGFIDQDGNDLRETEFYETFHSAADLDLVIICYPGAESTFEQWWRQVGDPYDVPIMNIQTEHVYFPTLMYTQGGQISGNIVSARGAAEYESILLENYPDFPYTYPEQKGKASSLGAGALFVFALAIVLVIYGNIVRMQESD